MNKIPCKLAKLTVDKDADYHGIVIKTLKDAGFTIVQEHKGYVEDIYIIADKEGD